jgi:alpha-2-macroglobulin
MPHRKSRLKYLLTIFEICLFFLFANFSPHLISVHAKSDPLNVVKDTNVTSQVYLLKEVGLYTPLIVINFSNPVAPEEVFSNFELNRKIPSLIKNSRAIKNSRESQILGEWEWRDPSRVIFKSSKHILPGDIFDFDLSKLKIRNNVAIATKNIRFIAPPFSAKLVDCKLKEETGIPVRRYFQGIVSTNYPLNLSNLISSNIIKAKINQKITTSLTLSSQYNDSIFVRSVSLIKPPYDSEIEVSFSDSSMKIYDYVPVTTTTTSCKVPLLRVEWESLEAGIRTKVNDFEVTTTTKKLKVRLKRENSSSQTEGREAAGKELPSKSILLEPMLEGKWHYGGENEEDLIFESEKPLPSGTKFNLSIHQEALPKIIFPEPSLKKEFITPTVSVSVNEINLYSDPKKAIIKRISAEIEVSNEPIKGSLESKINLFSRNSLFDFNTANISFSLKYDKKKPNIVYLVSDPIEIKPNPYKIILQIGKGVATTSGGEGSSIVVDSSLNIPSAQEYLKVEQLDISSTTNINGSIDRLINIEFTTPIVNFKSLDERIKAYLLPPCDKREPVCKAANITSWDSEQRITDDIINRSKTIKLKWKDNLTLSNYLISFNAPENRDILIIIPEKIKSTDGFELFKQNRKILKTGSMPRELKILHDGSLLSISGSKKLGAYSRGVDKVKVSLRRFLPENLNHFVALSKGKFNQPIINLPTDHFTELTSYNEVLPLTESMEKLDFSIDFSKFLSSVPSENLRGLFLLTVSRIKDSKTRSECSSDYVGAGSEEYDNYDEDESNGCISDSRLVLLTDLGVLVKREQNNQQHIFVISFRTGKPVANATVELLGKNGIKIQEGSTDDFGHVELPNPEQHLNEQFPTVYVVKSGEDISFLPYARMDRELNLSSFDVGGVITRDYFRGIQGYLFSDRGIYRPKDKVHIGLIVKKRDWSELPQGLPFEISVTDPRSVVVMREPITFDKTGMSEFKWIASDTTGLYRFELQAIKNKNKKLSVGYTTVRIEEFHPDLLQVTTNISKAEKKRWISTNDNNAKVTVKNLFGSMAQGNKVKLDMLVSPWKGDISEYRDFTFYRTTKNKLPDSNIDLGEKTTDINGIVEFKLPLDNYDEPIFNVNLIGEGFEKGSGRSVVSNFSTVVSRLNYLIGYRPKCSLAYINRKAICEIDLIALNSELKADSVNNAKLKLYKKNYISSLVKQSNGLYAYQSVEKKDLISSKKLSFNKSGSKLILDTTTPGNYEYRIKDNNNNILTSFQYTVAGDGNVSRSVEKHALLELKLDKKSYQTGDTINFQILAPYTGAGLVTIEQDKVIASKWITSSNLSSTHSIKVPNNITGNAYLSVAFVRSFDSKEIYMSPLSYSVENFKIDDHKFRSNIKLGVPNEVVPGNVLKVDYKVNQPMKVIIWAIDEGILQFAKYNNPAPLDVFFKKKALEVSTLQILDLILPDFAIVNRLSSEGGDEDSGLGRFKNPFSRKSKPPLVFWSGALDVVKGNHSIDIPIPSYFSGSVRILALGTNSKKIATATNKVTVKGPLVLKLQQPYAVTPDDEFYLGVVVSNTDNINRTVKVKVESKKALKLQDSQSVEINLDAGEERSLKFKVKAKNNLGAHPVNYIATTSDYTLQDSEELSIRPAQPLFTNLQKGILNTGSQKNNTFVNLKLERQLHRHSRERFVTVSALPFGLLDGYIRYLQEYPYGCTEQIVSQSFPAVILSQIPELPFNNLKSQQKIERTLATLSARQRLDGSFGLWSLDTESDTFYSVYAIHFIIEARKNGFKVSEDLYSRSISFLNQLLNQIVYSDNEYQAQAYATYLLALTGEVVTDKVRKLEGELINYTKLSGNTYYSSKFLLAATYKLLNLDNDAFRLFDINSKDGIIPPDLQNDIQGLGLYLYFKNRYFPAKDNSNINELIQTISNARLTSLSSVWTLLAVGTMKLNVDSKDFVVQAKSCLSNTWKDLKLTGTNIKRGILDNDINEIKISGSRTSQVYYQVTEQGYDKISPKNEISSGLSINRNLLNSKDKEVNQILLTDKLDVAIQLQPEKELSDIAVEVLIPGGFEIDLSSPELQNRRSLPHNNSSLWEPEYIDIKEDRLIFYGDIPFSSKTFRFRLKPLNVGNYKVPAIYATGMYDPEIEYKGLDSEIAVVEK